jgi:hypothetical protein
VPAQGIFCPSPLTTLEGVPAAFFQHCGMSPFHDGGALID